MDDNFNGWMRDQVDDVVEALKDNSQEVHACILESMTESAFIDTARLGYLIANLMAKLHDEHESAKEAES